MEMETKMEKDRQNYQLLYSAIEEIYGWYGP